MTIIFMFSMISLIYVGGLYLMNISEESYMQLEQWKDFVRVESTYDDKDQAQFKAMIALVQRDENIESYPVGENYYNYPTMLGFQNGNRAYVFNKNDFLRLNQRLQIIPLEDSVTDGGIFLSEKEAAYLEVARGDLISRDNDDLHIYYGDSEFPVTVFPSDSFMVLFVSEDVSLPYTYLLTWSEGSSKEQFDDTVQYIKATYDNLNVVTYADEIMNMEENFAINNIIYYSIIAIVTIVFVITTNAVLVGIYEKRRREFALYQGVGIPRSSLYRKVAKEILIMNGLGIILGIIFSLIVISILNVFVYAKDGLSMSYYNRTALSAVIICDMAIIIPGIGLRIRTISKEVKEPEYL